jgi:hypothetical protein
MANQFKSVDEMVQALSCEQFLLQWCICTIQHVFRFGNTPSIVQDTCYMYQDKRFYIDEFPGQEQLRFEWLWENKVDLNTPCTIDTTDLETITKSEWFTYPPQLLLENDDLGNFLTKRFLKRN